MRIIDNPNTYSSSFKKINTSTTAIDVCCAAGGKHWWEIDLTKLLLLMLLHIRFIIKYRSPLEPQTLYSLLFFLPIISIRVWIRGIQRVCWSFFSYQLSHISQNSSFAVSFPIQSNTLLYDDFSCCCCLLPFLFSNRKKEKENISKKRKRQSRFLLAAITAAPPAAKVVDPLIGKVERRNGQKLGPSKSDEEIAKRSREGRDL